MDFRPKSGCRFCVRCAVFFSRGSPRFGGGPLDLPWGASGRLGGDFPADGPPSSQPAWGDPPVHPLHPPPASTPCIHLLHPPPASTSCIHPLHPPPCIHPLHPPPASTSCIHLLHPAPEPTHCTHLLHPPPASTSCIIIVIIIMPRGEGIPKSNLLGFWGFLGLRKPLGAWGAQVTILPNGALLSGRKSSDTKQFENRMNPTFAYFTQV